MDRRSPSLSKTSLTESFTPTATGLLQRKCASCGQHTIAGGECAECGKKKQFLQRRSANQAETVEVPAIVHDVLRSPGQSLDAGTRTFMESRFGHDFSGVRVHTDEKAASSAQSVNALAYTVGRNVVFGAGQYAPGTREGKHLLAHELTHVVQQKSSISKMSKLSQPSDPLEKAAETTADLIMSGKSVSAAQVSSQTETPMIFRRVAPRQMNCQAGVNGASADPLSDLTNLDTRAGGFATLVAILLGIESAITSAGLRNPGSSTQQAYQNRFGLPPARPGGFLNRLTGRVIPTQDLAISEEMALLSRRFGLIERLFSQFIHYRCIGGASVFAGCAPPHCNGVFAWACDGVGAIFLCPLFWGLGTQPQQQAGILIHEAFHINLAEVRDAVLAGPGRNFRMAECYASFVADIMGFASPVAPCPAPP